MAVKNLSSPPSSIESESLFKKGGNIYTIKRSRLLPENGETLLFLNYNLRMLNYDSESIGHHNVGQLLDLI